LSRSTSEFSYYVQFKSVSSGDNFPAVTLLVLLILLLIAPINTDIIAGGASLAPSLWSLLADAMVALKDSLSLTALIVLIKKVKTVNYS
jgi:hypothetical protein